MRWSVQGQVQLDAAIMRGSDCALGAVGALEGCHDLNGVMTVLE